MLKKPKLLAEQITKIGIKKDYFHRNPNKTFQYILFVQRPIPNMSNGALSVDFLMSVPTVKLAKKLQRRFQYDLLHGKSLDDILNGK